MYGGYAIITMYLDERDVMTDINTPLKAHLEEMVTELRDEWDVTDPEQIYTALREDLLNRFEMILEEL